MRKLSFTTLLAGIALFLVMGTTTLSALSTLSAENCKCTGEAICKCVSPATDDCKCEMPAKKSSMKCGGAKKASAKCGDAKKAPKEAMKCGTGKCG